MSVIVARTHSGGRDLYMGVPDLKGAKVVEVESVEDGSDYNTTLTLETTRGNTCKLIIVQEKR
jgi:hypothetical protein